jgi:hypothetical protein
MTEKKWWEWPVTKIRVRLPPHPNPALSLMPEIAIFAMLRAEERNGINQRSESESALPE